MTILLPERTKTPSFQAVMSYVPFQIFVFPFKSTVSLKSAKISTSLETSVASVPFAAFIREGIMTFNGVNKKLALAGISTVNCKEETSPILMFAFDNSILVC